MRFAVVTAVFVAALFIAPAGADAAFSVSGFSVTPSTKQAGAHPNLTVAFNRGGTNSEDLRDFTVDYAPGQLFNPEAAITKCSSTSFSTDNCPSASVVGDFTVNANLEILGFSFPVAASGTTYVLESTGLDHATLGYIVRPIGYAKTYSKQVVQIRTESDGGQRTITTNIPRSQSLTWPRIWGSTNIAVTKLTLRYNARANKDKTGPYFTLNPTACDTSTTKLSATSYQGDTASSTFAYTPTGCTSVPFDPTMSVAMDNPTAGQYTGGTFTVDIPQVDAGVQQSSVKSVSALLPAGSGLNFALLGTYASGCLEADLLADTCPAETLVGDASAHVPFYTPTFTGEVYVMDPIGLEVNGAVVLRGPRGMKTIIRFTNTVQGGGATSRVLSTWDYVPHFPWSQFKMHISEPLIKNPACPSGAKAVDTTFNSYSGRTKTLSPTYTTTCPTGPASPVITSPPSGTSTNDTTPTISGTATPNATITVYDGATSIGTTTADAAGSWTFTPSSSIGAGLNSITATATDGTGTSTPSPAVLITVDLVAPVAPVITSGGGNTNDNTPTFGGTAEPGSVVIVRNGATALGSATANASGIWSFTASTLADGVYSITATATDAAGNTGPASAALAMTIDTVVPAAPSITSPANNSSTSDNTPTISGSAEAGSVVRVFRNGTTVVCQATATAGGTFSCDASPALADGSYALTATATDAAGNVSATSTTVNLTVAQTPSAPPPPTITSPAAGAITNDNTPTFSGTSLSGSTVAVLSGGTTTVCTATADAAGAWSCTASPALSDGLKSINATATNAGGTSAPSSARALTIDTTAPAAPVITSPANGSTTTDSTPTVSGTAEANSTVMVYRGGSTLVCSTTATAAGAFSCDAASALPDATYSLTATATDAATNVSAPSAAVSFTIAQPPAAPPTPVITAPAAGAITNDNTPTFSGTALAGTTVNVVNGGAVCSATTTAGGTWTCTPATAMTDGVKSITATATNAGGTSAPTAPRALTIDTVAPAAPVITSPGGLTNDDTPTVSGTAEANSTVIVYDGATAVGSTTANASGAWSFTPAAALAQNGHSFTARATDAATNQGPASTAVSVTIDSIAPAAPVITSPANGSTTTDTTPTVSGTAEANSTVRVLRGGSTLVCQATATAGGTFTCDASPALGAGTYSLTATATDAATNVSAQSAAVSVTVSTPLPAAPAITSPTTGTVTNDNTPTFSGTAPTGTTVNVLNGATTICTATTTAGGTWTCTPATALTPDGVKSITATATNANGTSSPSPAVSITIDTVAPAAPVITTPAAGAFTNDATPTISGTAEAGSTVTVANGTTLCTATANASGAWSCDSSALTDGAKSITATARDAATNTGPASAARAFTVDTVAPAAPVISAPAQSSFTNDNTPAISGTAEANSTVTVSNGTTWCTATANASGAWSCSPAATQTDGAKSITATARDAATNTGPASAARAFTIDTVAPAAPVINSAGGLTNDDTPTVSGTAEANSTVTVYDGAAAIGSATANASGAWSFTPAAALAQGAHTFTARATDAATNQGPASSAVSVTIDSIAPAAPVITTPAAGSFTNDTTPTVSGTAEAGSTVTVLSGATTLCTATTNASGAWSCDSSALTPDGSKSITATARDAATNTGPASAARTFTVDTVAPAAPVITTPAAGAFTNDATPSISGTAEAGSTVTVSNGTTLCTATANASGAWICDSSALTDGAKSITATARDAATNTGPASAARAFTVDTVAPAAPVITTPAQNSFTNDNTPAISGTAEANSTVTVSNGTTWCTATANASGAWSCSPAAAQTDGAKSITATARDAATNTSPASAARAFTVDTVAPAAPVITTPVESSITNDNTPAISGTAEANSTVTVSNGTTWCTATANASGAWSCSPAAAQTDGAKSITARAADAATNQSPASAARAFTIDTVAPAVPVITTPAQNATGVSGSAAISGTGESGTTITVREGATTVCSTTAAGGNWSCTPSPALANGAHVINATSVDAATNSSGPSANRNFSVGAAAKIQITTGPEGGLPIDISHWQLWYDGGVDPNTGVTIAPHPSPKWDFTGTGVSGTYECSLGLAAEVAVYAPCTPPFIAPFESMDDTNPAGNNYRFIVRDAANTAVSDTALFKVGPFDPTWNVALTTYQAMDHPDMTITAQNAFGDPQVLQASTPDFFWGSLAAIPTKCTVASAQAGTCATTAPNSKIGSITFDADVNPNPHNDTVPPHSVQRTYDAYLTPATRPGDAAGIAVSIRAIDDPAYGSLDYGTINYIARLKLRYEENVVTPGDPNQSYTGVSDPTGMDVWLEEIPNSTLAAPGVTPGPAGAADLHIREISATVLGNAPWYSAPLLYNSSACDVPGTFDALVVSSEGTATSKFQDYTATGCENLPYQPALTEFRTSDNGATDLISDIDIGVTFPPGSSTTKSAIVDLPREFVANTAAVQACLSENVMVQDPQASCPDTANLGTATAVSPLLPYPLTGDVIGEDVGGTLPNIYIVFKDPDIGLDTRIRGSAAVLKTGTGAGLAQGDFIRTTMNLGSDGGPLDLPSLPLTSLVLNLHQEDPGVILPDGSTSLGSIIKVGTTYACNDTAAARFILNAWSGATTQIVTPSLAFNCAANGQTVSNQIGITAGPANGATVTTSSVSFTMVNNHTAAVRLRTGLDDSNNALSGLPYDSNIEANTIATTNVGASRTVTFSGLEDGKVYKFLVQSNAGTTLIDQERRTFKVDLP